MTAFIHGAIARCIADFSAERQQLSVTLESRSKQQLIEQITQGTLDIAIVIGGIIAPGLTTFATIAMRVVCITPLQHSLVSQSTLHEKDLYKHRQIRLTAGSPLRVALEAAGIAMEGRQHQQGLIETGLIKYAILSLQRPNYSFPLIIGLNFRRSYLKNESGLPTFEP